MGIEEKSPGGLLETAIMNPDHPSWEEFFETLAEVMTIDRCQGDKAKLQARAVLNTIDGIDIDGSLRFFEEHGGGCSCEVLLNTEFSYAERQSQ